MAVDSGYMLYQIILPWNYPKVFIFKAKRNKDKSGAFGIFEYYDDATANAGGQAVCNQSKIGFLGQPPWKYNDFGTDFSGFSVYSIYKVIEYSPKHRSIHVDSISYESFKDYSKISKNLAIGSLREEAHFGYIFVTKYSPTSPSIEYAPEETGTWQVEGYTFTKRRKVVVRSRESLEDFQIALDFSKFEDERLLIVEVEE